MLILALRNLLRRPLRNGIALAGIVASVTVLICIVAFGDGYRAGLKTELDRAGVQMMLVPLGCPYDAAARVLKNNTLETSLPESALDLARSDHAVATAAPLLMAALPRPGERRTDLWVGIDRSALDLKPWWRIAAGQPWFQATNEVILGADAAAVEVRKVGDKFYSPETKSEFSVAAVLARSGTSDDSAIFLPLATAQSMFHQHGRLTAIAVRLKDPALMREATVRLQKVPGAQVVTITEMMGTFLNLVGAARTLVLAVAGVAFAISSLAVFNTLLAAAIERASEFAVMRALGASRFQVFGLLLTESVILTLSGALLAAAVAALVAPFMETLVKQWIPFAPAQQFLSISAPVVLQCAALGIMAGLAAALYPAWCASRLAPAAAVKLE